KISQGHGQGEGNVTFLVEEAKASRIGSLTVTAIKAYPVDQLKKRLLARAGRAYNPAFLIADTTRISRAYQDRGYIPHVSASMTRDGLEAHLRYDVIEGPLYAFGHVQVIPPPDAHVKE